jgi:xanthine dehydrogenase accessory factor
MDVHNILQKIAEGSQRSVLVTTASVEGHAYRKAGAMMLLMENGSAIGSVSPGCMENDLMERVEGILASNTHQLVEYDMTSEDDAAWGEAIGCGGTVRVLLEPVAGVLLEHLLKVKRKLDQHIAVSLKRVILEENKSIRYKLISARAADFDNQQMLGLNEQELVVSTLFAPMPRLIIFGAGNDAIPVSQLARRIGFQLIIADWRAGLCTNERFEDAAFIIGFPKKSMMQLNLTEQDYVIVMSHHLRWDREFVQNMLSKRVKYVGIMGSKARTELVLEGITVPPWFHVPVGLHISAEGPEEIAISILAELISIRRGKEGVDGKGADAFESETNREIFGLMVKQSDVSAQAFHQAAQGMKH